MHALLLAFWKDESAQGSGGFALFLALVVIILVLAFSPARNWLAARFGAAADVLRYQTN